MSDPYPPLREIIRDYGLRAEKKFGQNFLLDLNITRKISNAATALNTQHVVEIGPGPGGLTRAILEHNPKTLHTIEIDTRCVEALKDTYEDRITIVQADALQQDLNTLIPKNPKSIIANLPYNIATPLLVKWLKDIWVNQSSYDQMILMFQKEVAQRILAQPNSKTYGRLSILSQWLCDISKVMILPPQAFTPAPKVDSMVLKFVPKKDRIEADFETVEKLTAQAFQARRKMLRKSLKEHISILEEMNVDTSLRAENCDVMTFIVCANYINLQNK